MGDDIDLMDFLEAKLRHFLNKFFHPMNNSSRNFEMAKTQPNGSRENLTIEIGASSFFPHIYSICLSGRT